MNNLLPETSNIIYALGWAIVHALWQGMLVYMLLRIALRFIPENYAAARYYTSVSAIGVTIIWFTITLFYHYNVSVEQIVVNNAAYTSGIENLPTGNNTTDLSSTLLSWYNAHTSAVVYIYMMGIALLTGRLLYNLVSLRMLKSNGVSEPPKQWTAILGNCMNALTINKRVRLLLSEKVNVPMIMGTLKPIILIPVALANTLTIKEVEAILLHELAHVKRNDYLINIIQMFIETILFYNPFVWLISSIIRKEREHCCDDIVVMQTEDKLPYAKALAALETYRLHPAQPALAATGSKNQLLTRIKRIMEMKKNNINLGQLTAVLLIVVILLTSVAFIVPEVNAQEKKDKKKKENKTKTETIIESSNHKNKQNTVTSSSTGNNKSTTIISNSNDETELIESEIEKESLKAAKLALETANTVLTEIDISGIVADALKSIDWENINTEIGDSLKNVDWEEINGEIKAAMKEVNLAMKEVNTEIKYLNKNTKKEIEDAHKRIAEAHKEIAEASRQIAEARRMEAEERREAAEERREITRKRIAEKRQHDREMTDDDIYIRRTGKKVPVDPSTKILVTSSRDKLLKSLEKDGLIDRRNGFKIEKKRNDLYIDGIKQSKEVIKKYDRLLGDGNFTVKGNYRSIKISTDN